MESTIKDNGKSVVSLQRDLYASKMEVKWERSINDILMKFNGDNGDTLSTMSTTSDVHNASTPSDVAAAPDVQATDNENDSCEGEAGFDNTTSYLCQ